MFNPQFSIEYIFIKVRVCCIMLNRITTVEECDATDDDSSNAVGYINIFLSPFKEGLFLLL